MDQVLGRLGAGSPIFRLTLFSLSALFLFPACANAELGRDRTFELLRARQMQAEEERMQRELREPKKVEIDPSRAALGPKSAPIQLVVLSDFQCPYCAKGARTVEELRKKYGDKIRYVFLNLPMAMHPQARPAAQWFSAIALQSPAKAYQFHDFVFAEQERLSVEGEKFLEAMAKKAGADIAKTKKLLTSEKVAQQMRDDEALAKQLSIDGTPGFNVAGVTLKGAYPREKFEEVIEFRLKNRAISSATGSKK